MAIVNGFTVIGTATIASGASVSDIIETQGFPIVKIDIGPTWKAAELTLQVSLDGVDYDQLVLDSGAVFTVPSTTGTNAIVNIPRDYTSGIPYIKLVSGTSASQVVQTGPSSILYAVRYV